MAIRRVLPEVTGHRVWYRLKGLVETFPNIYISWGGCSLNTPTTKAIPLPDLVDVIFVLINIILIKFYIFRILSSNPIHRYTTRHIYPSNIASNSHNVFPEQLATVAILHLRTQ